MNILNLATNSKVQTLFCAIGATYLTVKTINLFKSIYKTYFRQPLALLPRYSVPNSAPYALITGGASGIGLAIAYQLSQCGFNLLIFDRNCNNLPQFPQNIDVKFFQVDLGGCDNWKQVAKLAEEYDVAVLVNNVGITPLEEVCDFGSMNEDAIKYLLNLNMFPCVFLCHHFIQLMLKREVKSCIINISSMAAATPQPYLSTYCASKTFIDVFTQAISWEYKDKIDIMSVKPGPVQTALNPIKLSLIGITPEICAKGLLRDIGHERETFGARYNLSIFHCLLRCHKILNSLFSGSSVQFVGQSMKQHLTTTDNLQRRERRLKEWNQMQEQQNKNDQQKK